MKSKKITIIRHGQSNYNVGDHTIQDSRLSDLGISQSSNIIESFDILILSPLKRSLETYINSQIIAKNIIISNLFIERNQELTNFETLDDLKTRVHKALQFIRELDSDNIGIISHGCFMRYILEECDHIVVYVQNGEKFVIELCD